MTKRILLHAIAAVIALVMFASPASNGATTTEFSEGNFYGTAELDITQVTTPEELEAIGWVCFPKDGDFDCERASEVNFRDFIGFREGEVRWVVLGGFSF